MQFRGGMNELLRQASRLQRKVAERKEALRAETFEASTGDGQVTVVANGGQEIVSIKIAPELLKALWEAESAASRSPEAGGEVDEAAQRVDAELASDLLVAGVNAALARSRESVDEELSKLTGGAGIPGMM